jgi:hypothetical protein
MQVMLVVIIRPICCRISIFVHDGADLFFTPWNMELEIFAGYTGWDGRESPEVIYQVKDLQP